MMDRRGQAYTLEGVVSALILLSAVLFALQALIVTPTTSGTVDPDVQSDLRQQSNDILVTTAANDEFDLSTLVRYWDQSDQTFYNATNARVGYGSRVPPEIFGTLLSETFSERSRLYNVEMRYLAANSTERRASTPIVFQGDPSENAIVATYTVTLYDRQTLTSPTAGDVSLAELDTNKTDGDDGYYPVPNAVDGPVYNVVEVRIVVW
ncbi:MAG: hypothetical protein V5A45_03235 [Haloarculaceae archaeon]